MNCSEMNAMLENSALLIIDVQKAIEHPSWGKRNNPELESNLTQLLAIWRLKTLPVYHIQHLSTEPNSTYRPRQIGCEFKPEVQPCLGEIIIQKHTNSAFIGTDLEQRLRKQGHQALIVTGVITNNSVETTVRMAENLGFKVFLLSDATATFGLTDLRGKHWDAEEIHALSLANMHREYATVITTPELLLAI